MKITIANIKMCNGGYWLKMTAVLINDKNESMFVAALSEDVRESSDLLIGAVDEETDTACGIVAVSAVGNRMLSIRHVSCLTRSERS